MICLLVSYPWQIICHLATELKRELKELWTNSRLGLLEHVPRNLPLQIFLLQLQLCNMRLKMVDHLQGHKITHKMIEKNRALNIC